MENKLLMGFCEILDKRFGEEEFDSKGQAIIKATNCLREWQYRKK